MSRLGAAGAWHIPPVPSSPGDTAASTPALQQGWAPLLTRWFNWFLGEKAEELQQTSLLTQWMHAACAPALHGCSQHSSPHAWGRHDALRLLAGTGTLAEGSAGGPTDGYRGVQVAASSNCHLLVKNSSQEGSRFHTKPWPWAFRDACKGYGPVRGEASTQGDRASPTGCPQSQCDALTGLLNHLLTKPQG